ncbi:MAG TPA: malate synthase A [Candidatus Polarisedimenticolia bacterium]|nr:malate synthase A [Candidatus Polarisedimenticolia bacterium]
MTTPAPSSPPTGLRIRAPRLPEADAVLTPAALAFVEDLARRFAPEAARLLERRARRQEELDRGTPPRFLEETRAIREGDWTVAPLPGDLLDRRVEITGPVDRKMILNALNSGASVFMADFEDATTPTWENLVRGQANLREAVSRTLRHTDPATGKEYRLGDKTAVLCVRPRGWHLPEAHVRLDGAPIPGALFDFGVFFFHNARTLVERGSGPYFYLPKMQSHLEARLWNEVFLRAQEAVGLPAGTIKATVLIETLPAAFEMDEILWELRQHSAGLNCGRWDYIFSFIKTRRADPGAVLPDRAQVTMEQPFMRAYTQALVRICHRRGVHAMGGMAAQIPIKNDPVAGEAALAKVRADKEREVRDGHDGTWVAHPGLVPLAREIFDRGMPGPNQIARRRDDVVTREEDLLRPAQGTRTEAGLRRAIVVGLRYLDAWLGGLGCVPLDHLMEDAATAEICRTQIWQWVRHGARLEDGRIVDAALVKAFLAEETGRLSLRPDTVPLFEQVALSVPLIDFLTLPAYERLVALEPASE